MLFRAEKQERLGYADGLMSGDKSGDVSVPTAEQNGRAPIIELRQTEAAVLLRHFDSKGADLGQPGKIFRRNFARAIDLVRIDMLAQIRFELLQKWFARGAIVRALFRKGMNAAEIVATDEKIARETAAIVQRIARRLSQLERFPLTLRHP